MAKSAMKYMVRAWDKELKKPVWGVSGVRSRKQRKNIARTNAYAAVGCVQPWYVVIDSQDSADEAVAEDVSNWN